MKTRLRFHFKAIQYEVDEDNNVKSIILDVTNRSKAPLEVNRHSYVSNLNKLYKELDERSQYNLIFKPEDSKQNAGSNWIIHKYISLAVDIFAVNSVRGSSYIPTPEKYSNAKCGLVNIRNEDAECFRCCMLYHQSEKGA